MENILVPIDFSEASEKILEESMKFAKAFDAKIVLIHVALPVSENLISDGGEFSYRDMPEIGEVGPMFSSPIRYDIARDAIANKLKEEHKKLLEYKKMITNKGVDARAILCEGGISETIINEAHYLKTDLIVLGSHAHGALYKVLLGSITDGVLRDVDCPVLTIPIKDDS